jgi:single-stranded-DNA-specific exonuclease
MLQFPPPAGEAAMGLARTLRVTRTAGAVLVARGLVEAQASQRFLDPRLADLTIPDTMKDRVEAVERIVRAVRAKERICIFGDYDADGVTAAALLTDVLRALGAEVVPLLADRFHGGYGLSQPALARVLDTKATLLITCDCGSSDHERLEAARQAGLDVVVIDHHRVPDAPLPVVAFLNPHRPDCGFAYKGLASVGLAFSIGAGVRTAMGVQLDMRRWLDLVAIGTIGDVAPLDGDNRALVRAGLMLMAKGTRHGTKALAEVAGCAAGAPTGEDVSFRLAPRINAPGRLDKPDLALALLLADSEVEARRLAVEVEDFCTRRKEVERAVYAEALAMLEDPELAKLPAIVLGQQGWHAGVVGIVAGRLASRFRKPAIVLALDGARARGSVRGPAGFSVYDALVRARDVLVTFGGHHAAAGVEIESARLDALRDRFCAACVEEGLPEARGGPDADAVLHDGDRADKVLDDLERFEPCGQSNPSPRIAVERTPLLRTRELTGGHLRLWIQLAGAEVSCFGPEMGPQASRLGSHVRLVGALKRDTWQGRRAAEMRLIAAEPA